MKNNASNPLSNWLDDKLIIVGLDKSSESKLRRNLEADLTKSFIKDVTKRKKKILTKVKGGEQQTKENA